jgi:hypothetical protein
MIGLNYDRLNEISLRKNNHYRGDKTRFPIGTRKQNNRCFYVREENGEKVFEITYGQRWSSKEVTKEEYEALKAAGKNVRVYAEDPVKETVYMWYDVEPNLVGVVRPDNTFEFVKNEYHQGERGFLSAYTYGYFINDSRRGGMVYSYRMETMHPIWQGMRVNCATMEPTQEYQVFTKQVNRKSSKELTAPYKDFLLTSETMLKAMDWATFISTCSEIHKQYMPETGEKYVGHVYLKYGPIAERVKHEAPLDAAVLFMLQLGVGELQWDLRRYMENSNAGTSRGDETPEELFVQMKRGINKVLYRAHKEVFKRVEQTAGKRYPAGDWGVEVIVDGKEVKQYGYGL